MEKTMDIYLKDIKSVCSQLSSIGSPVSERMKVFAALHGLGKEYEPIKTTIESSMDSHPPPTFEDVVPRLTSYEDRLQSYVDQSSVTPNLAFYSNRGRGNFQRGGGRGQNRGYSTRGRGFHQHVSPSSLSSVSSDSDSRPICQICGKPGHQALRCWHKFDNGYQSEEMPHALAALPITDVTNSSGHEWFSDSGATTHVTNSPRHLQQSQAYTGSDSVMVGNGEFLPITHTGSTSLSTASGNIPLNNVLVCPDMAKSILSVSQATSDYPCAFVFDSDDVRVFDKSTKQLLLQGSRSKGLYKLSDAPSQVFYSSRQVTASDDVWHQRLGHPNLQVLQQLSSTKSIYINKHIKTFCETCQLAKSSRLLFAASTFVTTRPLERLHCDLWGPSPVMSVQGFRYYVVFIDNYSRFC